MSLRNAQSKNWVFTWNNPDYDQEPPNVWPDVRYAIWQHEVGEQGTPHFQGYVVFTKNTRVAWLIKNCPKGIHWEPRRGTHEQAKAYASKEDTRTHGPWVYGEEPQQGKRNDLQEVADYVKDHTMAEVAEAYPSAVFRYAKGIQMYKNLITPHRTTHTQLIIYWGPPRTGKSSRVRELWPDAYWLKRSRSGEPWWDGYDGHQTVVIDEFYGWIGVDLMTRLIDQFPLDVEGKGTSIKFTSERVVVLSNADPWTWWSCELHGMRRRLEEAVIFHVTTPLWLEETGGQKPDPVSPDYNTQVAERALEIRAMHDLWHQSTGLQGRPLVAPDKRANKEGLDEHNPIYPTPPQE